MNRLRLEGHFLILFFVCCSRWWRSSIASRKRSSKARAGTARASCRPGPATPRRRRSRRRSSPCRPYALSFLIRRRIFAVVPVHPSSSGSLPFVYFEIICWPNRCLSCFYGNHSHYFFGQLRISQLIFLISSSHLVFSYQKSTFNYYDKSGKHKEDNQQLSGDFEEPRAQELYGGAHLFFLFIQWLPMRPTVFLLCRMNGWFQDRRNFVRSPPAGVQFEFDYETMYPVALATLVEDSNLQQMRFDLVPKMCVFCLFYLPFCEGDNDVGIVWMDMDRSIKEELFWRNYFYRVSLIRQSTQLSSLANQGRDSANNSNESSFDEDDKTGSPIFVWLLLLFYTFPPQCCVRFTQFATLSCGLAVLVWFYFRSHFEK